ncbi:MAG: hypothetical protein KJP00_09295 [Bacteroidia bacterium]|nr:hypothetical protein [Bacteroidia bacterium]
MKNNIIKTLRVRQIGARTRNALLVGLSLLFVLFSYSFLNAPETGTIDDFMQGVEYRLKTEDYSSTQTLIYETLIQIAGRNLKIRTTSANGEDRGTMIFRGDQGKNGEVSIFDPEEQEYVVIDDATVQRLAEQMSEADRMMKEALKHLTPEQREAMQKARKEGADIPLGDMLQLEKKPERVKTKDQAIKNGYKCTKYEYRIEGQVAREVWSVDWDKIKGGAMAKKAFFAMGDFFKAFENPSMFDGQNMFEEMNLEGGVPVVVKRFDKNGKEVEKTTLESANELNFDPDDFDPLFGYKRRDMFRH